MLDEVEVNDLQVIEEADDDLIDDVEMMTQIILDETIGTLDDEVKRSDEQHGVREGMLELFEVDETLLERVQQDEDEDDDIDDEVHTIMTLTQIENDDEDEVDMFTLQQQRLIILVDVY